MPGIGMQELIIIFIMGLIIFGPGKLPELGRTLGKAIREFRRVSNDVMDEIDKPIQKKEVSIGVQKADKNETAIKDDAVELLDELDEVSENVSSKNKKEVWKMCPLHGFWKGIFSCDILFS